MDDFFATPAFRPDEALQGLARSLRSLGLTAQGPAFVWQGKRVAELSVESGVIRAAMARRPAMQAEFERRELKSAAEVRHWQEELKKRLVRWSDE